MDSSVSQWVGIDLGTTNSIVAIVNQGKVDVLFSSEGSTLLKSSVHYEKFSNQYLVGRNDLRLIEPHNRNTIYDAKRLIGVRFNDDLVRRFLDRRLPFDVINYDGWAGFHVQHAGQMIKLLPEDVGATILEKLRTVAEDYMDGRVEPDPNSEGMEERCQFNKAVITVPATFSQEQRLKTIDAGRMVFDEVHLITEASAAAYAVCRNHKWLNRDGNKFLVYDFGGGTFDTCIIYVEGGEFHARYLDGDRELGGGDLDRKLRDYCAAEINAKYGVDLGRLERSEILLERCERLKVRLSQRQEDGFPLEFLNIYEHLRVTRQCFEELCKPFLMRSIRIVQRMMKEAKLTTADIDQVLLVGGTSNIPLVRNLFLIYLEFPPEKLNHSEKATHANAEGAAIVGNQLGQDVKDNTSTTVKLIEYTPLSLGDRIMDNIFSVIIPRNHRIPCKLSKTFCTVANDQQSIRFSIYEGERKLATENFHLGDLFIRRLPLGAAGDVSVDLSFEIDRDGILLAVATHGDIISSLKLCNMEHSSDCRKVKEAIKSAEANFVADTKEEQRQHHKYDLEGAINRAKYKSTDQRVIALCAKYEAWLKKNHQATSAMMKDKLGEFRRDLASIS